jgi:hypothetical protein
MSEDWKITIRWGAIGAFLGGISMFLVILNQAGALEGYWLAHRDFVREEIMEAGGPISEQLTTLTELQYGTQITVLDGNLRTLNREKLDIEAQLKDDISTGTRRILDGQLSDLNTEMETIDGRIRVLRCALEPKSGWCSR